MINSIKCCGYIPKYEDSHVTRARIQWTQQIVLDLNGCRLSAVSGLKRRLKCVMEMMFIHVLVETDGNNLLKDLGEKS